MADLAAINSIARRIAELLESEVPKVSALPNFKATLDSPSDLTNADAGNLLSVFLYRIEVDEQARPSLAWQRDGGNVVSERPLFLRLHFLLIPITEQPEAAHLLLTAARAVIESKPILELGSSPHSVEPVHLLSEPLVKLGSSPQSVEPVDLIPETLSLQDMAQLWVALGVPYRISAAYFARAVLTHSTP